MRASKLANFISVVLVAGILGFCIAGVIRYCRTLTEEPDWELRCVIQSTEHTNGRHYRVVSCRCTRKCRHTVYAETLEQAQWYRQCKINDLRSDWELKHRVWTNVVMEVQE